MKNLKLMKQYLKKLNDFQNTNFQSILIDLTCCSCGSLVDLESGRCLHCESESKGAQKQAERLDNILSYYGDIDFILSYRNSYNLLMFYQFSKRHFYRPLDDFLKKNLIQQQLEEFIYKVNETLLEGNVLSKEDDVILGNILELDEELSRKVLISNIIKSVLVKKPLVSCSTFVSAVREMVIKTMQDDLNHGRFPYYHPSCEIVHFEDNRLHGDTDCLYLIRIGYSDLEDVYHGNMDSFVVVFHELFHVKEGLDILAGEFYEDLIPKIMEHVIFEIDLKKGRSFGYYNKNYKFLTIEKDANVNGYISFFRYLDSLQIGLKEEYVKKTRDFIEKELQLKKNLMRDLSEVSYLSDDELELEEVFLLVSKEEDDILRKYPQLEVGYVIENNQLRKKTLLELELTLQGLASDDVFFQEKSSYLNHLMMKFKKNKQGVREDKERRSR